MLPVDVLRRVLLPHAGDASTLCAAACVAKSWHHAATQTPSLWRQLRLKGAALERLTDERLVRLVARAGGELEQLSGLFEPDTRVTVRGVAAALRGHAGKLTQLTVRGVKRDAEVGASAADVEALLRSFLRDDGDASLDVTRCAFCCAYVDREDEDDEDEEYKGDNPCGRLCSRERDLVCAECEVVYCEACADRANRNHDPPCNHLCSKCMGPLNGEAYTCYDCDREGRQTCVDCKCSCDELPPCVNCRHTGKDTRVYCCQCDRAYCEECWLGRDLVLQCADCHELFCEHGCADFVGCHGTPGDCEKKQYCQNCAMYSLRTVGGVPLCTKCAAGRPSDEDAEEEEEE
jgi:hypothetical protein